MLERKILQIIPAQPQMIAHFVYDGSPTNDQGQKIAKGIPVCCLALTETSYKDGLKQEILPMIMNQDGYAEPAEDDDGFVCISVD